MLEKKYIVPQDMVVLEGEGDAECSRVGKDPRVNRPKTPNLKPDIMKAFGQYQLQGSNDSTEQPRNERKRYSHANIMDSDEDRFMLERLRLEVQRE